MGRKGKNKSKKEKKKQVQSHPVANNKSKKNNKERKKNFKVSELEEDLIKRGLRVKYILPDGNCFFRAIGDQLYGTDEDHMGIREMIMTYIEENREMYEPFIEACQDKGETFEDYIKELRKEGMWAGEFEVHAASLLFNVDICIYQMTGDSIQCLCNKNPMAKKTIHLSYHDGEHYNSVRNKDDYSDTMPNQIDIINTGSNDKKVKDEEELKWTWKDEKRVMEETGCMNDKLIHDILKKTDGNVTMTIAEVCEWMIEHGESSEIQQILADENNPMSMDLNIEEEEEEEEEEEIEYERKLDECKYDGNDNVKRYNNNKCPCGSGKKYKKCCKVKEERIERSKAAAAEIRQQQQETSNKHEKDVVKEINLINI